jgi:hypothetical protein
MKKMLQALSAFALAFLIGMAFVQVPDAAAQQHKYKGKGGGGGPVVVQRGGGGHHHGGHRRGGRNHTGKIVGGVAAGIAGAIILNEIAKSQSGPSYRGERQYYSGDSGGGLSCRQLRYRCEDGRDWACRKFDRQC